VVFHYHIDKYLSIIKFVLGPMRYFNPDFAVGVVARRHKSQRNAQLERFRDAGIIIIMLRNKIVS
jgi:hypothetical protein